jgi:hypothetical protein
MTEHVLGSKMQMEFNTFVTGISEPQRAGDGRLPVRTAAVTIFVLSLLSWMPIVLPILAYFRH